LVSWGNLALVPLLGFLALAAHLATGPPMAGYAAALAWASFAFAAIFPLHRLFTADQNPSASFLFYGTIARVAFIGCFFVLSGFNEPATAGIRRRNVVLIIAVSGALALLRYVLKGPLDALADAFSESDAKGPVDWARRGIELLAVVLAIAAVVRLMARRKQADEFVSFALPVAFVLTAVQSWFFLFSEPNDLLWWSANVVWGLATVVLIVALLQTIAEAGRPAVDPRRTLQPGSGLGGYEIIRPLGEGGMGQVYLAKHRRMNRLVALKWIRPDHETDATARRRFHREAQAFARLAHPNIVEVYDSAEIDGFPFLAMEYIEGDDLARLLRRHGRLPVALACEYIRQACLGLQHAHERGLVHRDIKPANLLLAKDGRTIKLLDLGVARFDQTIEGEGADASLTQTGSVMGTPAYLAPEQARDPRGVDIRADIYSLGCTFYHLVTGRVPFEGLTLAEVVLRHQVENPAPIDSLRADASPSVARLIGKMMAKHPDERFQTPGETAAALEPLAVFDETALTAWYASAGFDPPEARALGQRHSEFRAAALTTLADADAESLWWYFIVLGVAVGIIALAGWALLY
jgi:tRNA A-37 threonylcarbamoyl transferase component Bud32